MRFPTEHRYRGNWAGKLGLVCLLPTPPATRSAHPPSIVSAAMSCGRANESLEAQHQREMIRIHEMWQQTKGELAEAKAELAARPSAFANASQRDKAVQELQALTVELRDKCRFTELQLAGAREESSKFSASCEELRQRLSDAQGQLAEMQAANQANSPRILELQGTIDRLNREKRVRLARARRRPTAERAPALPCASFASFVRRLAASRLRRASRSSSIMSSDGWRARSPPRSTRSSCRSRRCTRSP